MPDDTSSENIIHSNQLQQLMAHYDNARLDGLCHAGAWEIVLDEIRHLNLSPAILLEFELYLRG